LDGYGDREKIGPASEQLEQFGVDLRVRTETCMPHILEIAAAVIS
jgi:hypothetical protein